MFMSFAERRNEHEFEMILEAIIGFILYLAASGLLRNLSCPPVANRVSAL